MALSFKKILSANRFLRFPDILKIIYFTFNTLLKVFPIVYNRMFIIGIYNF